MSFRWFPFTFYVRGRGRSSEQPVPATYSETERYVGQLTNLPLDLVARIYRAGRPWPVALDDFRSAVEREVAALHCSVEDATRIVLTRLQWQKARAESGGPPMDTAPYQTWHQHRERVARRLGENLVLVNQVHHGVLKYRWQEGKPPD